MAETANLDSFINRYIQALGFVLPWYYYPNSIFLLNYFSPHIPFFSFFDTQEKLFTYFIPP